MRQVISFWADTEKDADLLAWLDGQINKSAAIRAALRAAMQLESDQTAVTEAVAAALASELAYLPDLVTRTVKDALAAYRLSPAQPAEVVDDEPAAAAANLDGLLDRLAGGALD